MLVVGLRRVFHVKKKIDNLLKFKPEIACERNGDENFNRNQKLMRHSEIHIKLTFCKIVKKKDVCRGSKDSYSLNDIQVQPFVSHLKC